MLITFGFMAYNLLKFLHAKFFKSKSNKLNIVILKQLFRKNEKLDKKLELKPIENKCIKLEKLSDN